MSETLGSFRNPTRLVDIMISNHTRTPVWIEVPYCNIDNKIGDLRRDEASGSGPRQKQFLSNIQSR